MRVLQAMWAMVLISGCGAGGSVTELRICGDLPAADIELVRVVVADLRGVERFSAALAMAASGDGVELPLVTEIPRQEGRGLVSVEARSDGLLAARATVRSGDLFMLEAADFTLTQSCRGVRCPVGQSCIDSECGSAPTASGAPPCP